MDKLGLAIMVLYIIIAAVVIMFSIESITEGNVYESYFAGILTMGIAVISYLFISSLKEGISK